MGDRIKDTLGNSNRITKVCQLCYITEDKQTHYVNEIREERMNTEDNSKIMRPFFSN